MDILAHGLWATLIFKNAPPTTRTVGIALSLAPDLIAFVPNAVYSVITNNYKMWFKVSEDTVENMANRVPPWVYRIYDVTHSIPLWIIGFSIAWAIMGSVPWAAFGWLLHIIVDIPTHSRKFFPTPFLWPLSSYKFDGYNWEAKWYMIANYVVLLAFYLRLHILR